MFNINIIFDTKHNEKKRSSVNGLVIQFLNCITHLQFTIYTMQLITTQLQLCCNNSFSTTMQFPYDYIHNVMLTSFFIHPSKLNMWHYEDFSWFFWNIEIHYPLWLFVLDGLGLWHMAQSKVVMWHINWILETNIYVYLRRSIHS
jgi:hypothetical protein